MERYAINTRGLTRHFGSIKAVDGVDLHVPAGGVYGFLGPNGAGKTTTIRMLLGLIRPNAGEVWLLGAPLDTQRRALLRHTGALVETPSLYPNLTGRENLEVIRRLNGSTKEQIDRALETVRLQDAAHRLVKGYSLGMKQRLGLAVALLPDPELLILDEPTNGLDPAGIHEIRDLIRRLPAERGITVFLSSHLLGEIEQVATHIGIINGGKLAYEGTLEALQAQRGGQVILRTDQPQAALDVLVRSGWQASPLAQNGGLPGVTVAAENGDAARVNAALVAQGINVFELKPGSSSLEDIFLSLTGMPGVEETTAR